MGVEHAERDHQHPTGECDRGFVDLLGDDHRIGDEKDREGNLDFAHVRGRSLAVTDAVAVSSPAP